MQKLQMRLEYKKDWDFYNQLFDEKWNHRFEKKNTDILIRFYDSNPFAIIQKIRHITLPLIMIYVINYRFYSPKKAILLILKKLS